jgi:hypothetical protein
MYTGRRGLHTSVFARLKEFIEGIRKEGEEREKHEGKQHTSTA